VHAVADDVDSDGADGAGAAGGNLVGPSEVDDEVLTDVVAGLVARRERKPQEGTRNADQCLLTHPQLLWCVGTAGRPPPSQDPCLGRTGDRSPQGRYPA